MYAAPFVYAYWLEIFLRSQEYRESIPQDMRVGSEVMRISATDIDDGDNRLIEYDLNDNNDARYFKVDKKTGILKLDRSIDVSCS